MSINNDPIARSQISPCYLNYGYHSRVLQLDILQNLDVIPKHHQTVENFVVKLHNDWQYSRLLHNSFTDALNEQANASQTTHNLQIVDKVLVFMPPVVREQLILSLT